MDQAATLRIRDRPQGRRLQTGVWLQAACGSEMPVRVYGRLGDGI
jgi:hypothetical protein